MHRRLVDLDRMIDEEVVLSRNVEVLVAYTAGIGKVGGVGVGSLDTRGQDIVIAMAVAAVRQILT